MLGQHPFLNIIFFWKIKEIFLGVFFFILHLGFESAPGSLQVWVAGQIGLCSEGNILGYNFFS